MNNDEKVREALGRYSRRRKTANMIKVYFTIAKEPSSFSELLQRTDLSKPVLSDHLRFLEKHEHVIYRHAIKPNETFKEEEIGKVLYYVTIDEIPRMLNEALSLLGMLVEPFEDKELNRKLWKHTEAIGKILNDYITKLKENRDLAFRLEVGNLKENLKKELENETQTKKPEFNWTDEGKKKES